MLQSVGVRSVIVLNDFCQVQGGASRVAVDEAVALSTRGFDVTFLGAVGPVCPELAAANVKSVCLDQPELADAMRRPTAALRAFWNQRAYQATRALLATKDRSRTIVHLHGYTKALTTAPALAARRAGFPVVCTLHDFFAACPNGAFFDYRRQIPCQLRALSPTCITTACDKRHQLHKAYRVARGLAQRHVARFPASVRDYITLSRRSASLLKPYLPGDARFHELANIIDVPYAPPVDVAANRALVVVGRLDAEKGVELAAQTARAADLPIVFVGDGPLRPSIEATGARVTGWVTADRVQLELEQARCLVFPSLWYETYGLVVAEAAARGVPAIVSDVAAPSERLVDGQDGWVFRSGDRDSLLRCMQHTRCDAAIRQAGATAYRQYWADPSDPTRHAAELASIYAAVMVRDASIG
jgi:glycosyltransferase involved in cell wall biosynthesis